MFGTPHFSVAYPKGRSTVEVNVMQGVDLAALDSNMLHCMVMKAFVYWPIHNCHSMATLPHILDSLTPRLLVQL